VEMQTGEGKTYAALPPAFVHALTGRGVHVLTVNDYLAQRDCELMQPVFRLLGMSVGLVRASDSLAEKQKAYRCDVTYGPGHEFGFDYLRDQAALLAQGKPKLGQQYHDRLQGRRSARRQSIQRGLAFCIVDEVDSVLIDEATTPLVLSGSGLKEKASAEVYSIGREAAAGLKTGEDYVIDRVARRVSLTRRGTTKITAFGHQAAQLGLQRPWTTYVRQALHAKLLVSKDVDYILENGKVLLVDQNTGRVSPDRQRRDGLHQAIEVQEDLPPTPEQQPLSRITRQRFFQLYDGLCGMTGTATGNEREFRHFYRRPVTVVPPRRPNRRRQLPTRFFADQESKITAIPEEIKRIHATRQPVLVGTRTIEVSELLAARLRSAGIPFQLLNGKQDKEEAEVVAQAGRLGAVTIATNMAGRGTDIRLSPGVPELGGLHVIGAEQHELMRVDRQLIGRAARQGEPGSCQFFVSAEDRLIRLHAPKLAERMARSANDHGETSRDFSCDIAKLQRRVGHAGFAERQQMFAHDQWIDGVLSTLVR
jgi:preprotein translocase subunit SecA